MPSPKISTFREITPQIYSWTTTDIPKYAGWEKIGYTEQEGGARARIDQQASQLSIGKKLEWVFNATSLTPGGGRLTDHDFHAYLKQQGVERDGVPATPERPKRTEWHRFDGAHKTSRQHFLDFASGDFSIDDSGVLEMDYELRPEQRAAVKHALEAFGAGKTDVLWNAKPRFGKTLTTFDLMRQLGARRVLIVTNRPAIANSWLDDFRRFIGHQTTYRFVSESPSLSGSPTMTRKQWSTYASQTNDEDPRIVEFLSLQDLKGSVYFGGSHEKLKHVAQFNWDLLVIDEAHEGVDTTKTDVAFDQIKRQWALHLSGTPFKALAAGKFDQKQIFNWTYEDEQRARVEWNDPERENPYAALPTLNLLTYQVSRMISDRLAEGVAVAEDEANIDYAFDLGEFFRTKDNGYFEHEADVQTFLDRLAVNEKYPFSTPELRDEIRHSFWLLDRVASAKALQRLLKRHDVFKEYTVVLAAGDGRGGEDDSDLVQSRASLDKVREAIADAEKSHGKTITLSVGQLTTGVTIPEWTAVVMLSNVTSPALYMQAAFRAQNPCTFERQGQVYQKKNAYIFDFAPERTLTILDEFANNLRPNPSGDDGVRRENIKTLLNFFPVIGEDAEGRMVELNASQVLTFPKVFKAREVVRRGFLSNLLFANVAGIFRYSEQVKEILDKLPTAQHGKLKKNDLELPEPMPIVDRDGNVEVSTETVINPKVAALGAPVWRVEDIPTTDLDAPSAATAKKLANLVTEKARDTREKLQAEYGLSKKQVERDEKATEAEITRKYERVRVEHEIALKHLQDDLAEAATEAEAEVVAAKKAEQEKAFHDSVAEILMETSESITRTVVEREENKKEQKRADQTMDDARSHLRGFARTIPMFLMAYGDRGIRLSNLDDYTPDDVFEEITGISEAEFRLLRDGQDVVEDGGTITKIPGLFDEAVFDQSIQEFLDKKDALADYFDGAQTESIFAYIPQQKTSLVFTPQQVVKQMVDILEAENPGIFTDRGKTFADLFSTAGLFLMELVRRLDTGLADQIPEQDARLKHIFTSQLFEMSHSEILHEITLEAVSGGVPERRRWLEESGHFRVGVLGKMSLGMRQLVVDDMLRKGNLAMDRKFDVVIGNPPYHNEAAREGGRREPLYHLFMDAAFEIGKQVVVITPARFLSNAGQTPKAWNTKMLADEHLQVAYFEPDSNRLFPGLSDPIKGGIVVTHRDADRVLGPIGTFARHPALDNILHKVEASVGESLITVVSSGVPYSYTQRMHEDHPSAAARIGSTNDKFSIRSGAFAELPFIFHEADPKDGQTYAQLYGLAQTKRTHRFIRRDYIAGEKSFDRWKVAVSAANGTGSTTDFFGIPLTNPVVLGPGIGVTQTFITVGSFGNEAEAEACLKYLKSKFARAMLGVLKVTQHNQRGTWQYVPLQDFTGASDIDWGKPIPEIDQQLYAKYGLDGAEIEFIESHVKPMS